MQLTLLPAYGRDYKSKEALVKDWEAGKDFKIATANHKNHGAYTSIRDLKDFPGKQVKIRYNRKTEFILVNILDGTIVSD
jgi:hypothetical protein